MADALCRIPWLFRLKVVEMSERRYNKSAWLPKKGRSGKAPARSCALFDSLVFPILIILSLALVNAAPVFAGQTSVPINDNNFLVKRIVILPFESFVEKPEAVGVIRKALKDEIKKKGLLLITDDDVVEEFLARRRTRYTNSVTRVTAREMGMLLDADAVMVGSIDSYSEDDGEVRAGITARLVSTIDGSIIWADNVAYTGRDFEGLLGLGTVRSVEKLSAMVVRDFVKGIPDKFFLRDSALSPFEVADVTTYPLRARSGDNVKIKVKMLSIIDDPKEVRAVVNGKEVSLLKTDDPELYEGVMDAPSEEGAYPVDLVALDAADKPFSFKSAGVISVDNTPPKVALKLNRTVFAPKRKGFVLFTPMLKTIEDIDGWEIEILNSEGEVVRNDRGFGNLPKELIWRGEANKLRPVGDGDYRYKFIIRDASGNETVLSDALRVKNTAPEIQVDVEMSDNKLRFIFESPAKDEEIENWKLSILENGRVVNAFDGKEGLPPEIDYTFSDGADLNKYSFTITAIDKAGNPFELSKPITSSLLKKTPFAKLIENRLVEDF